MPSPVTNPQCWRQDLNLRPFEYQSKALNQLSYANLYFVPPENFEISTLGLRDRCSASELWGIICLPNGTRTHDPRINFTTLAFIQANYVSCCGLDYFLTISFDLGSPYIVSTPFYLESHRQSLCRHKRGFCLLAVFYIPTMIIAVFSFRKGCTLISKSVALSLLSYGQFFFLTPISNITY